MDDATNPPARVPMPVRAGLAAAAIGLIVTTASSLPGHPVLEEAAVLRWANGLPRAVGLPLEAVMPLGTFLAALVAAGVALVARRPRLAVALALAWALTRGAAGLLKAAVGRDRPPTFFPDVALRAPLPADHGFPSGHAGNAAALAVVVAVTFPRLRWPAAAVAVAVGLARLYVGVHLPLDVAGGWCLGTLGGTAAVVAAARLVPGR